jgi:hypothetical protein
LIVAPSDDLHAIAVGHVLRTRFEADVVFWDTDSAGEGDGITFGAAPAEFSLQIASSRLDLARVSSVWWRRPRRYGSTDGLPSDVRRFCTREYSSLVLGGLAAAGTQVVNNPQSQAAAQRKPLQLAVAGRVGLRVPQTIVSNEPTIVQEFWEGHHRDCVYKSLTPTPSTFRETRPLTEADLPDLHSLSLAPIIVQQRLHGANLRVTVMGRRQFAAIALVDCPEAVFDWRVDLKCRWEPYTLEPALSQRIQDLLIALGLHYGCVDLRFDDSGEPYFLEVNPAGQFLFIEVDTAQPIVEAMCALLVDPRSAWVEA